MEKENKWLIPGAIVVAGILIAGAMFLGGNATPDTANIEEEPDITFNPITDEDHLLGSPDARLTVVEYSDIDCPFCQTFHGTMHQIIDEYGPNEDVAWVYRHLPLVQLHPDARVKANASECVADLGGNTAFWNYVDILFERDDEGVDQLDEIAAEVGVDSAEFNTCLSANEHDGEVQEDFEDAQRAGATGTPYSLIIIDGEIVSGINGAQPYTSVKAEIDRLLSQI